MGVKKTITNFTTRNNSKNNGSGTIGIGVQFYRNMYDSYGSKILFALRIFSGLHKYVIFIQS